MTVRSIT